MKHQKEQNTKNKKVTGATGDRTRSLYYRDNTLTTELLRVFCFATTHVVVESSGLHF